MEEVISHWSLVISHWSLVIGHQEEEIYSKLLSDREFTFN